MKINAKKSIVVVSNCCCHKFSSLTQLFQMSPHPFHPQRVLLVSKDPQDIASGQTEGEVFQGLFCVSVAQISLASGFLFV